MAEIAGKPDSPRFSGSKPAAARNVWNEMTDADGRVRPVWQMMEPQVTGASPDERATLALSAARMIEDLGSTYNVFRDVTNKGQPFGLDPIPLLLSGQEWETVSAGLRQRIRLLDAVLADLYGPGTLMDRGLIPPGLVHSNPSFLHWAASFQPGSGRFLTTTGCDLVRLGDGHWRVLADHTNAPGGLGQVYENRNVIANLLPGPFDRMEVAVLREFLEQEKAALFGLVIQHGDGANVVFLTEGFRHPSYFEHAYKARLLGIPLVERQDLTVRGSQVFLKTLAGLRRVDGIVYRIADDGIDPLQRRGTGGNGVAGLGEAWRRGNVAIANVPGAAFGSSASLMPFLPRIAAEWFGEPLALPFVETWWLGQAEVRREVMRHPEDFVFLPAHPQGVPHMPFLWKSLSPVARKTWLEAIADRPHDFVVQPPVRASEAPCFDKRVLNHRPVLWRAFSLLAPDGKASVMKGGLAQVGKRSQPPQLWPSHEGATKDVWVLHSRASRRGAGEVLPPVNPRQPTAPEVPSRMAEQLYWVGRYAERIEHATRLLRVVLRRVAGEAGHEHEDQIAACAALMCEANLLPEDAVVPPAAMEGVITMLVLDPESPHGVPARTRALVVNAASTRDRLSDDMWRFINLLETVVHSTRDSVGSAGIGRRLDTLILHLAAFSGMQAENMTRGHGWRFMETGRRVERAMGTLALLDLAGRGPDLRMVEPILETCDSMMTYRRRHLARPTVESMLDLLFMDPANPRSVAMQIEILAREAERFPPGAGGSALRELRDGPRAMLEYFRRPAPPDPAWIAGLQNSLTTWAELLTGHFFSHSIRGVY